MYWLVGLRSYAPYHVLAIGLHLKAAALLRVIMRRAGVVPWISTVPASLIAFFGTASQEILWAFQIAFSGALVLGLVQLLLADHDGSIDRRSRRTRLRLSLEQLDEGTGTRCVPVGPPVDHDIVAGESFVVRGTIAVQLIDQEGGITSAPVTSRRDLLHGGP